MNPPANRIPRILLAAAVTLFFWIPASWAISTENREINLLPAPKPPAVDGSLTNWDRSAGVLMIDGIEKNRDLNFVWLYGMYDKDNLYLLARVADETPMQNYRGKAEGEGFRDDSLQIRFLSKEGAQVHLTAWSDRAGLPVMDIVYGSMSKGEEKTTLPDALAAGAKTTFTKWEDGKGYNQVLVLPWKLIFPSGQAPKAGDSFGFLARVSFGPRLAVQDIYSPGNPDKAFTFRSPQSWGRAVLCANGPANPLPVRLEDGSTLPVTMEDGMPVVDWSGLQKPVAMVGDIPIELTLDKPSYVTIAIDAEDGTRVRNLIANEYLKAGKHTVLWDGLGDGNEGIPGEPVPVGKYHWKGLVHGAFDVIYRGVYNTGANPPWGTGQGSDEWGGDHGKPDSAVAVGDSVILGWQIGEAGPQLIGVDLNGQKRWGARHSMDAHTDFLCRDGNNVYCGPYSGTSIILLDGKTGQFKPFPTTNRADMPLPPLPGQDAAKEPSGMAAADGKVYLSFLDDNLVAVLDPVTGKYTETFPIQAPGRLTASDSGTIYALSGKDVDVLHDGKFEPLITSGLEEPKSLTTDARGNLYVADWGGSQQVKVFDTRGKLFREIGMKGGRPLVGPWDGNGFRRPLGLAVDAKGQLWVGEYDFQPKRWSVWSPEGKFVRDFFGPSHYGSDGGALNPEDPYLGIGSLCEWRVDPETGKAKILGVVARTGMMDVPFPFDVQRSDAARYVKLGGEWYLAQGSSRYYTMLKIFKKLGDGNFRPAAIIGNTDQMEPHDKKLAPMEFTKNPLFAGKEGQIFVWTDKNGDGQAQADELQFRLIPFTNSKTRTNRGPHKDSVQLVGGWQQLGVDDSLTAYLPMSDGTFWRFPMEEIGKKGEPLYDLSKAAPVARAKGGGYNTVMPTIDGGVVVADSVPLEAFDTKTGKRLWTYPNGWEGVHGSHHSPGPSPGLLRGIFAPIGSGKLANGEELIMLNSNVGEWHAFTKDGLYVTSLFKGFSDGKFPAAATPGVSLKDAPPGSGGEDFGGFFMTTKDGRAFAEAGKTAYWILEITGGETIRRLPGGALEQTEAGVRQSKLFQQELTPSQGGAAVMNVPSLTPQVDGKLTDWKALKPVEFFKEGPGRGNIGAALAWDDTYLYVFVQVRKDETPWVNGAQDPFRMFLNGDTVDVQLAADPGSDPKRKSAVPGDVRISIGESSGGTKVVAYREAGPDFPGGQRLHFSSGVVKDCTVQSAKVLENARSAVVKTPAGYTLEASIPWNDLGIVPKKGLELRGDIGVTFGASGGGDTALRKYWSNQKTGLVDDEVFELRVTPNEWGTFKLE